MTVIDLNCDVGEGGGREDQLMPLVTSASVACGAHAGDEATMRHTLQLAAAHHVVAGAHPGFADRANFGRHEQRLTPSELRQLIWSQLTALRAHGAFTYVKPHGALYNMAARDAEVAAVVATAVRSFDPGLGLLALAGSALVTAGLAAGLNTKAEAFADRAYDADGQLVSRERPGALWSTPEAALVQVLDLMERGQVRSLSGAWVSLRADSICLHGDHPQAVAFATRLRAGLKAAGVTVTNCWTG